MKNKKSKFGKWLDTKTFQPQGPTLWNRYICPCGWYEGDQVEDTINRLLIVIMGSTLFVSEFLVSPVCGAIKALDCLVDGGSVVCSFLIFWAISLVVFVFMCAPNAIISLYHTKRAKRYISTIYNQNFKFVFGINFSDYEITILSKILGQAASLNSPEYFSHECSDEEEAKNLAQNFTTILIQKGLRELRVFWDIKPNGKILECQISEQMLRLLHGENIDHR